MGNGRQACLEGTRVKIDCFHTLKINFMGSDANIADRVSRSSVELLLYQVLRNYPAQEFIVDRNFLLCSTNVS